MLGRVFSRKANAHKVSVSKPAGKTSIVISEVDGRILLKLMLKKWSVRM
jgi:hypothetical protein